MMVGERAPYWDEHLRGAFLGLSVYHTKPHLFRAVLEGIAYAMRYSIEAARDAGLRINRAMLVNGGAKSQLWRQIIADVTGLEMDYIPEAIGAPLGDALLAGLGAGVIEDYGVIEEWLENRVKVIPNEGRRTIYDRYYELYKQSLNANKDIFRGLSEVAS
jgi:sugar (pentulose or hexulose) kinase